MSVFSVGDIFTGGSVFYIHNNIAYISSSNVINGMPLLTNAVPSNIISQLSDFAGNGLANHNALRAYARSGTSLFAIEHSNYAGVSDWHVPSIGELQELYSVKDSLHFDVGFNDSVYYYSSSLAANGNVKVLNGASGATQEFSPYATANMQTIYIRRQATDGGGITISDGDITPYNLDDVIDFTPEEVVTVQDPEHITENINYSTGSVNDPLSTQHSCLVAFSVKMDNLGDGYSATPDSLFGNLPNIVSAHTDDHKHWYKQSNEESPTLTAIQTGEVYHLVFDRAVSGTLTVVGEKIDFPYNYTIPSGISWLPFLSQEVKSISRGRDAFFTRLQLQNILLIQDWQTLTTYPLGNLNNLHPNRGYYIKTNSAIDVQFDDK